MTDTQVFDKVTVLYEGRQIYFGPCSEAKKYFFEMGFECTPRQTTADFLTGLTSPFERRVRPGYEGLVPSTAEEFAQTWQKSQTYERLIADINRFNSKYPVDGDSVATFTASRRAQQAKQQYVFRVILAIELITCRRIGSPYTLSLYQQITICVQRGFQRLRGDASVTISRVLANAVLALVVGSMFYNLQDDTDSFYSRSVLIFLAILLNAFASALEVIFNLTVDTLLNDYRS